MILFIDPPTLAECLQSIGFPDLAIQDAWYDIGSIQFTHEELPQFRNREGSMRMGRESVKGIDEVEISAVEEDEQEESYRYQIGGTPAVQDRTLVLDDVTLSQDTFQVLPPPISTFASIRNPSQDFFATQQDSYAISQQTGTNMGPPPGYDWNPRLLTRLNKLWDLAEDTSKFSKYDKPKMNLLAVISVINALRETKNGHVITEWTLRDQSGASLKMTLWGATGVAWTEHVKVGDVIYVKGVGIAFSSYNGELQGTISGSSELQVCYRTRCEVEDDEAFVWHPNWAIGMETAKMVMEVVDWAVRQRF